MSRRRSREERANLLFEAFERVPWWRWRERRRLRSEFAAAYRGWLYDTSL